MEFLKKIKYHQFKIGSWQDINYIIYKKTDSIILNRVTLALHFE